MCLLLVDIKFLVSKLKKKAVFHFLFQKFDYESIGSAKYYDIGHTVKK